MKEIHGSVGYLIAVILVVSVVYFIVKNNDKTTKSKYSMSPVSIDDILKQHEIAAEKVSADGDKAKEEEII